MPQGAVLMTVINLLGERWRVFSKETWLMTCNHAESDKAAENVCKKTLAGLRYVPQTTSTSVGTEEARAATDPTHGSADIAWCGQQLGPKTIGVECGDSRVSDLSPLAGLSELMSISLRGLPVTDISPLAGLASLRVFISYDLPVSDFGSLTRLPLQILSLEGSPVRDLTRLPGLGENSLQSLDLSETEVSDLAPLAGLTGLRSLSLMGTAVTDLRPIAGLKSLESLNLMDMELTDVKPLAGLKSLKVLNLMGTPIPDLGPLEGLQSLEVLHVEAAQNVVDRLKKALPACQINPS
jgi:internalin A